MSDYEDRLARLDAQVDANIAEHGWHVTFVFPHPDDNPDALEPTPSFLYTVGLAEKGLPELLVFGTPEPFHNIINGTARSLVERRLEPIPQRTGQLLNGLDSVLLDVDRQHWSSYVGGAIRRAAGRDVELRVLQLVWPDASGAFPWEQHNSAPRWQQPILGPLP